MNQFKTKGLLGITALFFAMTSSVSADIAAADNIVSIKKLSPFKQTKTAASAAAKARYVEGEVIVKYKAGVTVGNAKTLAAQGHYSVAKSFKALSKARGQTFAVVKGTLSTEELMKKLKADPNVEAVSPNYISKIFRTEPNDPQFNRQWGLNNTGQAVNGIAGTADADIDAPEAWDHETGVSDTVVAVFDTGVDYTHEDLAANMWINPGEIDNPDDGIDNDGNGYIDDVYGADFAVFESADWTSNNDGDPMDIFGHGTHVAGIVGAVGDNGKGIAGVNWDVKIMAMKVFSPNGYASDWDELEAIDYVLAQKVNGVNIVAVNASYGHFDGDQNDPMNDAIQQLGAAGIVFCAAAGNETNNNDATPVYPASYDASNIISVAATDQNDVRADFSNYGATTVDLAAPGVNIYSTLPGAYTPDPSDFFYDDFESGSGEWSKFGTNNTWDLTTEASVSGSWSFTDSPNTNYANETNSLVLSEPIDLSSASEDVYLGFKMKLDVEEGADTFSIIGLPDCSVLEGYYLATYSGEGRPWESYTIPIIDELKTANFCFGFVLNTNGNIVRDGVYIDDVGVGVATMTTASNTYGYKNGTSMATPFVSGAVALLASAYPAETAAERRDRILLGVDKRTSLSGKVATGGRLNLNGALQVVLDGNNSGGDSGDTGDSSGGGGGGGGLPVYDTVSLLLSVFGFIAIGGLIARKRLSAEG